METDSGGMDSVFASQCVQVCLLRYLVIARSRCVADGIWLQFASLCCGTEAKREIA